MTARKSFIRSSVAGLAIAAFGAVPVMAADVVYQEPPAPAPAPMVNLPVADWSGPYAGVTFGYGFGGRTNTPASAINTQGWMGGAFGGFNMQNGQFVYGVEGDVNYTGIRGGNAFESSRSTWDGSVRARAGVAVTDDVLVYATAGGAVERQRITNNVTGVAENQALFGYTVGAGVDAKLTDQVFGRVEYRFTDYGRKDFANVGGNVDTRNNRVNVGLGFKF